MFQLLPCSRCQRTFSVRQAVSDAALLKCPNCGNQFRIGELLDAFYSPWQVLEDPGTSATAEQGLSLAALAQPAQPISGNARDGNSENSRAEFSVGSNQDLEVIEEEHLVDEPAKGLSLDGAQQDFELAEETAEDLAAVRARASQSGISPGEQEVDWSKFKPITHDEFQRMRRSQRSGIWSTLQIVLGGAAAIPVSLLLIWYVLGKDVAGAGPAVAQYVPWIVPQQFRGAAANAADVEEATPARPRRRGESGFRTFDVDLPPDDRRLDDSAVAESERGDDPLLATLADGSSSAERATSDRDSPHDTTENSERSSEDEASTADAFSLLMSTKQKVDDWKEVTEAETAVKKEAAISLFNDLCSLGVHFSLAPNGTGATELMRERMQDISRAIKRQPDLVEVLHNAAKAQLNGTLPRSQDGWALVCTIGATQEAGGVWRVMVADSTLLPLQVPTIEIPKSIAPQIISGQRLLLLGRFAPVENGEQNAEETTDNDHSAPANDLFRASFSYGM